MSGDEIVEHIINLEHDPITNELPDPSGKGKKRVRKLFADIWEHYDLLPVGADGKEKCKCKKCSQTYLCGTSHGTKNLHRHLNACPRRNIRDVGQLLLSQDVSKLKNPKFDHGKFRDLVTTAVVMHDLPFQFVEWTGIRNLLMYLRDDLHIITRNTLKSDCMRLFKSEKERIKGMLKVAPGRISFTSDCWTSVTSDGYICLTAHYVDDDWVLQKKILNFCYMPSPHTGIALAEKIYGFFTSWGVNKKIFSLTLDNASANDLSVSFLKGELNSRDKLVCGGAYFHVRCCAHVLNLAVKDGLKFIDSSVVKIRECVKYVKGSQSRKQRFLECVALTSTPVNVKRRLRQDVDTRWNSTYLMLDSALYFREALIRLSLTDDSLKHCPTQEEWKKIKETHSFLGNFYNLTLDFSATKNPTSNLFLHGVSASYVAIKEAMHNDDSCLKEMAKKMFEKFNKYWSEFSTIMAIAVVLDPRYKFFFVDYCLMKVHGDNWKSESIRLKVELYKVFDEYTVKNFNIHQPPSFSSSFSATTFSPQVDDDINTKTAFLEEFKSLESEENTCTKSQLDLNLEEPRYKLSDEMDRKFDILNYWKTHAIQYPEVAAMARDVLSVPITSVASESAFSMGGKVLDQYRSLLDPDVVEALMCSKNWLFSGKDFNKENATLEAVTAGLNLVDKKVIET